MENTLEQLIAHLEDTDSDVQVKAIEALGELGDSSAVPALTKMFSSTDHYVRRSAVEALGKIGGESTIPALIQSFYRNDQNISVIAASLIMRSGEKAIPFLVKEFEDTWNPDVQGIIVWTLGEIGSASAIPVIVQKLQNTIYPFHTYFISALF